MDNEFKIIIVAWFISLLFVVIYVPFPSLRDKVVCTPQMISDLKEARASHQYFLDNYHPEYYNFTSEFQSLSAKETEWKAQAWERRWIKVYDTLLGSCNSW